MPILRLLPGLPRRTFFSAAAAFFGGIFFFAPLVAEVEKNEGRPVLMKREAIEYR